MISILDQQMKCPKCGWSGNVGSAEVDEDDEGRLRCPVCLTVLVMAGKGEAMA